MPQTLTPGKIDLNLLISNCITHVHNKHTLTHISHLHHY